MQRQSFPNTSHIPYSKWAQHRADNGRIYLAHPVTGEVKWLWSRHHDPQTNNDYLVNTITGVREWVTKENSHLCPAKFMQSSTTNSNSNDASLKYTNPFTETKNSSNRLKNQNLVNQSQPKSNYRQIAAPKSLSLTADEVLMLAVESGRRYIYNKKTGTSRWLPDTQPDTISSESNQKSLFGIARSKKLATTAFDDKEKHINSQSPQNIAHHSNKNITTPNHFAQRYTNSADNTHPNLQNGHQPTTSNPKSTQFTNNMGSVMSGPSRPENQNPVQDSRGLPDAIDADPSTEQDPVESKLQILDKVLDDVRTITTSPKYDMKYLRTLVNTDHNGDKIKEGSQRLLELSEYLTQQMLKVDGVSSNGNDFIRTKRKEAVNTILKLTDEVDELRKKLKPT